MDEVPWVTGGGFKLTSDALHEGKRLAYEETGKITLSFRDVNLGKIVQGHSGGMVDLKNGKPVLLVMKSDSESKFIHALVARLDAELESRRYRIMTVSTFTIVNEYEIGSGTDKTYYHTQYYVSVLPHDYQWKGGRAPSSLDLPVSNSVFNTGDPVRVNWFTSQVKRFNVKREQFRQAVTEIKVDPTINRHLRLYPLFYQGGMDIVEDEEEHTYVSLYPQGTQLANVRQDHIASVFTPIKEFISAHRQVIPAAFDGVDLVVWRLDEEADEEEEEDLVSIGAAGPTHIQTIDLLQDQVVFASGGLREYIDEFFGASDKYAHNALIYRILLTPDENAVHRRTVPASVSRSVIKQLIKFSHGGWRHHYYVSNPVADRLERLKNIPDERCGGSCSPRFDFEMKLPRELTIVEIAKRLDEVAEAITMSVFNRYELRINVFRKQQSERHLAQQKAKEDEEKAQAYEEQLELKSPLTGSWANYCINDLEYLTRESMSNIRLGADIVSILPPQKGLVKGFCYRRANLIRMMTNNIVYQWPRAADVSDDIMFHKIDPSFWVTHDSLELVQNANPRWSLFELRPVGEQAVGTRGGEVSAMHGTRTMIYSLVPLKTRQQVQEQVATLTTPITTTTTTTTSTTTSAPPSAIIRVPSGLSGLSADRKQTVLDMIARNRQRALDALQAEQQSNVLHSTPMQIDQKVATVRTDFTTRTDFKTPLPPGTISAIHQPPMQPVFRLAVQPPPAATTFSSFSSSSSSSSSAMDIDRSGGFRKKSRRKP